MAAISKPFLEALRVVNACEQIASDVRLSAISRISHARLLAVSILLRDDLSSQQQQSLLRRWENVTFRIYGMLGNDARTSVGDYVRLAWKVLNANLTYPQIDERITRLGRDFPIETAVDYLREADCYNRWEIELRYFFFRYEEYLARSENQKFSNEQWNKIWLASASDSIEHILPQSKASEKQKHRLGNLVLLPPMLNSKLQDIAPSAKLKAYRSTGLLIAQQVADQIEDEDWKPKSIEDREERLLKWAAVEWAD